MSTGFIAVVAFSLPSRQGVGTFSPCAFAKYARDGYVGSFLTRKDPYAFDRLRVPLSRKAFAVKANSSNSMALFPPVSICFPMTFRAQRSTVSQFVNKLGTLAHWFYMVGVQYNLLPVAASSSAQLAHVTVAFKNGFTPKSILNALTWIYNARPLVWLARLAWFRRIGAFSFSIALREFSSVLRRFRFSASAAMKAGLTSNGCVKYRHAAIHAQHVRKFLVSLLGTRGTLTLPLLHAIASFAPRVAAISACNLNRLAVVITIGASHDVNLQYRFTNWLDPFGCSSTRAGRALFYHVRGEKS